ncbi:MAG: hypothetical protein LBB38_02470 [Puniceicoccales bacterium]|jgi:hypothetical protein|nr:hypothetical protein [Puniceicoccales bacterium]
MSADIASILRRFYTDPSRQSELKDISSATAHMLNGDIHITSIATAEALVKKYRGIGTPFSITYTSKSGKSQTDTLVNYVDGDDRVNVLCATGMSHDSAKKTVEVLSKKNGANGIGARCVIVSCVDGHAVAVSKADAEKVNFRKCVILIYFEENNEIKIAARARDRSDIGAVGGVLLGDGSRTTLKSIDILGGMSEVFFTPSSKSGAAVALKAVGGTGIASGLALIIGLLTALCFNIITFVIAIILVIVGIAASVGYEFVTGNSAA